MKSTQPFKEDDVHYEDRKLYSVSIGGFSLHHTDEKLASVNVDIDVSGNGHDDQSGPGISVGMGIPASEETTLAVLRDQAIERAYWLIQRIASEPLESLKAKAAEKPLFDFTKS